MRQRFSGLSLFFPFLILYFQICSPTICFPFVNDCKDLFSSWLMSDELHTQVVPCRSYWVECITSSTIARCIFIIIPSIALFVGNTESFVDFVRSGFFYNRCSPICVYHRVASSYVVHKLRVAQWSPFIWKRDAKTSNEVYQSSTILVIRFVLTEETFILFGHSLIFFCVINIIY